MHHFRIVDLLPTLDGVATLDRHAIFGDISAELRAEMTDTATGFFGFANGIERE